MDLHELPSNWAKREDSVTSQLADLRLIANRLGFYGAADAIKQWVGHMPSLKYGCYCDLEDGMGPDECVIDEGRYHDCIYANPGMRKEQCDYWRIVTE